MHKLHSHDPAPPAQPKKHGPSNEQVFLIILAIIGILVLPLLIDPDTQAAFHQLQRAAASDDDVWRHAASGAVGHNIGAFYGRIIRSVLLFWLPTPRPAAAPG